jgi:hypothetical protein
MGYTKKEATDLASKLTNVKDAANKIPAARSIKVTMDASQAYATAANLQNVINNLFNHSQGGVIMPFSRGGPVPHYAGGGSVNRYPGGGQGSGAGTSTSDSIDAKLSAGEYVVNAKSFAANAGLVAAINGANGPLGGSSGFGYNTKTTAGAGSGTYLGERAPAPAMPSARRHYTEYLSGSSGGSSQPMVAQNHIYIAGSVWSEQELMRVIQEAVLSGRIKLQLPAGR